MNKSIIKDSLLEAIPYATEAMIKRAMNPTMTPTSWRILYGLAGQRILSGWFMRLPSGRTVIVPAGQVIVVDVSAMFLLLFPSVIPRSDWLLI